MLILLRAHSEALATKSHGSVLLRPYHGLSRFDERHGQTVEGLAHLRVPLCRTSWLRRPCNDVEATLAAQDWRTELVYVVLGRRTSFCRLSGIILILCHLRPFVEVLSC